MRRRSRRKPTLLGEAFAMKQSAGWEDVADSIQIKERIANQRRRLMQWLLLGVLLLLIALVILFNSL